MKKKLMCRKLVSSLRITSKEEDDRKTDEEEDGTFQEQLECKLRTYKDALNSIRELYEFSLHHNNSELFDIIWRARIMTTNQDSWSTYAQKTLLHYWKK
jgi:hypothetical protein